MSVPAEADGELINPGVRQLAPHPLDHALDMRDRRFRQDAMAEIEDMRPAREHFHHLIDFAVERGAAGE